MSETPLELATRIFESGRINDPEDWDEMYNEIESEMMDMGEKRDSINHCLTIVKKNWYPEEKRGDKL